MTHHKQPSLHVRSRGIASPCRVFKKGHINMIAATPTYDVAPARIDKVRSEDFEGRYREAVGFSRAILDQHVLISLMQ